MREIKFRGMGINGEWYYGNLSIIKQKIKSMGIDPGSYISNKAGVPFAYKVRPETVGQYTGLKDKNGRKIYEGDILRVWEENKHVPNRDSGGGIIDFDIIEGFSQFGVVDFKSAWFTYETKKHQKGREEDIFAPLDFTNNFEVAGNIYEDSELIESK
ncbi:YopX family protein [Bacillus spizizenii]|nr:YopX family protein [Bacillus spizizenii]MCY7839710.1 YopX family protein [Bacillus spizizenii]